ncbi:MAG TPA: hypothetical protein VL240_05265 [Candidatus Binatia bacterium]|nr:hypothetical protein [Candidatus Binatia bacterium]
MAEAWRSDAAPENVEYPTGVSGYRSARESGLEQLPELPVRASASRNSRAPLNRSAEAVGRSVGTAVAGVRRFPRQIGRLRSRIHLVTEESGAAATSIRDSAMEKAAQWRRAAESGASELAGTAEQYRAAVGERATEKLQQLRQQIAGKVEGLRSTARRRIADARHWRLEQPLRVLAVCAGVAVVAGAALRVWRSSSE